MLKLKLNYQQPIVLFPSIELPTTNSAVPVVQKDTMELLIDGKGSYYVDGQEVLNSKPETLFQAMSQALGRLGLTNFSMATAQAPRK